MPGRRQPRAPMRPKLSRVALEGLSHIAAQASVELEAGPDGAFGSKGGGSPAVETSAARGLKYLEDLLEWAGYH